MIRYYDEHGNRLNIRTELDDALDKLYDELDNKKSLLGKTCPSHATGNVVMITYASLSHAISVVFDRCPDILRLHVLRKLFQRLQCGCHNKGILII